MNGNLRPVKECIVCKLLPACFPVARTAWQQKVYKLLYRCEAHVLLHNGQYDAAYQSVQKALLFSQRDTLLRTLLTAIKADIFFRKHLYRFSLQEYHHVLKQGQLAPEGKAYLYAMMGAVCMHLDDYENAVVYLHESEKAYLPGRLKEKRIAFGNLSVCYLHLNKIKESDRYLQKSISLSEQLKDTVALATSYENIANEYYNLYMDREAIRYFKKGLALSVRTADHYLKKKAFINMAVVSENNKDFKSALYYRKEFEKQNDTLHDNDNIWTLAQQEKRLALLEKDSRLQMERQQNKIQLLELSRKNWQRNTFLGLSIAFLIFSLGLFYAYRQQHRQNHIITAQREQLDRMNRTKDWLFSVVSHDLRSPAQTMKLNLARLKTALHHKDTKRAEQLFTEVETISGRNHALINNLLYWSLSQTGRLQIVPHKLHVQQLVAQVFYDYEPVAALRNIRLQYDIPAALYCNADIHTMKIVLRNLVDNAIKFSKPFTDVSVSAAEEHNECVIAVTDDGEGMPPAVIKAFCSKEPVLPVSSPAGKSGTGLGLWLAKTMTEQNGGNLKIEDNRKGCTIQVHLPKYHIHE